MLYMQIIKMIMMMSVIIPAMDEERYIGELLDSLKNQTLKADEVIVADYSFDRTPHIAEEKGVKIIHLTRRGIGYARNEGAAHSKGDILVFIDADITLDEDVLENAYRRFKPPIYLLHVGVKANPQENPSMTEMRHRSIATHFRPIWMTEGWFIMVERERFMNVGGFPDIEPAEAVTFGWNFMKKYGGRSILYDTSIRVNHSLRRLRALGYYEPWGVAVR